MLLVYGDESIDETQQRVCAVAGVIGTEEQWNWIEPFWVERTRGGPFHANDCDSDHGDYAPKESEDPNVVHGRNKNLYKELTILLAHSGLGGFASAIDLAAQRKAFPSPYDPPLYYQGILDVLEAVRNAADSRDEAAKLTFDCRIESEFNAGEIYAYLQNSGPYWSDHLANKLEFESSRENPRLQMADLFACEAMKNLDNEIGPVRRKRKSWECLKQSGKFRVEKFGEEYFRELGALQESFMRILGIGEFEYADWIESKRLPHCHTSFLRFLFLKRDQMSVDQLRKFDEVFVGFSRLR